jgi:hypothetical protein
MRKFTHTSEYGISMGIASKDILTLTNFGIAVISGLIGSMVFEYLRKQP